MEAQNLYELIYSLAEDMCLEAEELEGFLCSADAINDIGAKDLHNLVYELARKGYLDEASLNNYLEAADKIARPG